MKWPEPDLTQIVPTEIVGLSPKAQTEILRTFNGRVNAYLTVTEYIAHFYPGESVWRGNTCGCTDDRCGGHHHGVGARCRCLDALLDELHDELVVVGPGS